MTSLVNVQPALSSYGIRALIRTGLSQCNVALAVVTRLSTCGGDILTAMKQALIRYNIPHAPHQSPTVNYAEREATCFQYMNMSPFQSSYRTDLLCEDGECRDRANYNSDGI